MITIKVNKKRMEIPTFKELTIKQYRQLLPYIADSGGLDIVRYISITKNIDYTKALHFHVQGLELFSTLLGTFKFIKGDSEPVKDISYIENSIPDLIIKCRGKIYDFYKFKPKAIGYRILVEQYMKTNLSVLDLYAFVAACIIESSFDYDKTVELKEELENYSAFKILSIGAFFLHKLKMQEKRGTVILRWLRKILLTNTVQRNHKLVLTDYRNISISKK
jgi:hypothetical protein